MTKLQGDTCPYCKHWDVVGKGVEVDCNSAHQECVCSKCDRKFLVVYKVDYLVDEEGEEIADDS